MENNDIFEQYAELVRRFKSGDESAFTDIYENSKKMVYVTCLGILNNEQDAEDAMQETYLTVYEKVGSLEAENTFVNWLKTIAANKARDKFKAKKNDSSFDDVVATEDFNEGDDNLENLPDAIILEKDKRDTFYKILRKELSDEQFQTTLLFYYDELPVAQIAQIMNCPENTVKSKLRLARVKIKAGIEEYEKKNNISILGAAAGTGSLGTFFSAYYSTVKVPAIKGLPVKVGSGAKSVSAQAAENAAKTAAKTGAKVGQTATGAGAKVAASTSLPKILAIVAASVLGVGAVGAGAILTVNALTNNKDDEIYELEYDGLYCNINKKDQITDCLRFYSDGTAIFTEYAYDSDNCFPEGAWFNVDSGDDRVEEGTYEVDGNRIVVTIDGTDYDGYVMDEGLYLDDEKYKFYEFDDIDGYIPGADIEPAVTDSTDVIVTVETIDTTETTEPAPVVNVTDVYSEYYDIIQEHSDELILYETAYYKFDDRIDGEDECRHGTYPSINFLDLNNDGIEELIMFQAGSVCHFHISVYGYNYKVGEVVCFYEDMVIDHFMDDGWGEAVLLSNGNLLFVESTHGIFDITEHVREIQMIYDDDKDPDSEYYSRVINHWYYTTDPDPSVTDNQEAELNGEDIDPAEYLAAYEDYKDHMVLPIMPDPDRFVFGGYSMPFIDGYDRPNSILPGDVFAKGNYYTFESMCALLKGDTAVVTWSPSAATPTPAPLSEELKEAYLDKINSITYEDFEDSSGDIPDSGEFTFDLVYINDDDVPELLVCLTRNVSYPRFSGDAVYANLYTFSDGEVIELIHNSCVVFNTTTSYYPRENKIIDFGFDNGGATRYYTVTGINEQGDDIETVHFIVTVDGDNYTYETYTEDYSSRTETTEEVFNEATAGIGESQGLAAEKTLDEITTELS